MYYNYDYVYNFIEDCSRIEEVEDAKMIFNRYAGKYNFLLLIENLTSECPQMFKKDKFNITELNIEGIIIDYINEITNLDCLYFSNKDPKKYILQNIDIDIDIDIKEKYIKMIPEYINEDKKNDIIKILKKDKDIFNFLRNIDLLISDHKYTKQIEKELAYTLADDPNKAEQYKLLLKHIYENMFGEIGDKEFSNNIICIDVNYYNKSNKDKLILHIYYIFILLYKIINPFVDIDIEKLTIELIKSKINPIVDGTHPTDDIKMHGFNLYSAKNLTNCFENISIFKIKLTSISKLLVEYAYWISLIERLYYLYPYKHTIVNIKIPYTIPKNNKIYLKNKIKSKLPYNVDMKLEYLKNKTILNNTKGVPINIDAVRGYNTYIRSYYLNGLKYEPYNNNDFINLINIGLYYKNILPLTLGNQFTLNDSYFTEITIAPSGGKIYILNKTFFNNLINFYITNYNVNIIIIKDNQKLDGFLIYTNSITSTDRCINPNDPIVLYYNKQTNITKNKQKPFVGFYFDLVIKINNILLNKI